MSKGDRAHKAVSPGRACATFNLEVILVNQAKLKSFCMAPRYMFNYEIPKDYNPAMESPNDETAQPLVLDQIAE